MNKIAKSLLTLIFIVATTVAFMCIFRIETTNAEAQYERVVTAQGVEWHEK